MQQLQPVPASTHYLLSRLFSSIWNQFGRIALQKALTLGVLCLLVMLSNLSFAQGVQGTVLDADEASPLSFATVTVLALPDSQASGGSLTDANGKYKMGLEQGSYLLQITFLGYESKIIGPVVVEDEWVEVPTIRMRGQAVQMDEVEISARANQMTLDLDKRVFRVDQDLSLAGSTADEILQNLPSVQVDPEGNVSLRGSQNVRILINGKPSGLVGVGGESEALRMLQGNMIESIEVITNPSARYDAEGEVGIINIILKKEQRPGFNGSIQTNTGWPHSHGLGANLNYRSGKFNFFTNLGVNYRSSPGGGKFYQELYQADTTIISEWTQDRVRSDLGYNIRMGADYAFTPNDVLTFVGQYRAGTGLNTVDILYTDYGRPNEIFRQTNRFQEERESDQNIELEATYRKTYERKDKVWTTTLQWQDNDDLELADIDEVILTESLPDVLQRSSNTENEANFLFQTDFVLPFGDGAKFETGAKATVRTIENAYLVEQRDSLGVFVPLPSFDNQFLYKERIYAGYAIFGQKRDKFSYQLGLRAEYTDIGTELFRTEESNRKQYLDWFPSAAMSYEIDRENVWQVTYSRRLSRPRFRLLLPFSNFSDARNFFGGNPDLDPEYTHSFETGYLKYWDSGSLLSSVYYRHRTGVIERITIFTSETQAQIIPVNLSTQDAVGFEFSGTQDLTSWWSLNGNLNLYRAITRGSYEGERLDADTYTWNTRINSRFQFPTGTQLQVSGDLDAPQITPQGRQKALYAADLGLSQRVLKGNGTLTFSVRDVFNTRWRRSEIINEFVYRDTEFQWRARQFTLSFSYRINQDGSREQRDSPLGEGFEGGD